MPLHQTFDEYRRELATESTADEIVRALTALIEASRTSAPPADPLTFFKEHLGQGNVPPLVESSAVTTSCTPPHCRTRHHG